MSLPRGLRLGPYEIVAALGAGGMGEVYRARDTRLDRSVAVKVVPQHLAGTSEVRQRFELEARAISSLQHPHICALHDVGSHDGVDYLVLELLEGETLATRLERGPLPLAEALRYGAQIADALAAAHRRGIVHRDLKPANVMLGRGGVKLLDFGLARQKVDGAASILSQEMTRATPLTAAGTVLGTLHYMAPEQLEGRAVDARADVFAFGAVLFEMVTGQRAFDGTSAASVISAILRETPPPVSTRVPLAPAALDALVGHCLQKDPEERWESAHDLRLQLLALAGPSGDAPVPGGTARRRWLPWGLAALATAAAAALAVAVGTGAVGDATATPSVRFELPAPPGGRFREAFETLGLALAPDGSAIGYLATAAGSAVPSLWVRPLDQLEARPLPGTEGASSLFWSPDGESIAFIADGRLRRVAVAGGSPLVLCDVPTGIGIAGTWGRGGSILFGTVQGEAIYRVPEAGGEPVAVVSNEETAGAFSNEETAGGGRVLWPWYLPDGERFLYLSSRPVGFELRLAEADGSSRGLATVASRVEWMGADWLVVVRDGGLVAQRFDLERGEWLGAPRALAPAVRSFGSTGWASFATSARGTVAVGTVGDAARLTWFAADGTAGATLGDFAQGISVAISPDGRRAIVDRLDPDLATYDLWLLDLERGVESRLTASPGTEVAAYWMPDGRSIVYSASSGDTPRLVRRDLVTEREAPLLPGGGFQIATGLAAGGRDLLFRQRTTSGGFDLWSLPLAGGAPTEVLRRGLGIATATLSPDGALLAYVSNESGRPEAYVRPLAGGQAVRASLAGAADLGFARDGRTLYFVGLDRHLHAVSIARPTAPPESGGEVEVGEPRALFALPPLGWEAFDVAPDGRFLALVPQVDSGLEPRTVISGWRG